MRLSPWTYTDFFKPFRHQIVAVKDMVDLPPSCKVKKGVEGSPFTVIISYGQDDPAGEAAVPIAELLTRLHEVEQKLRAPKP